MSEYYISRTEEYVVSFLHAGVSTIIARCSSQEDCSMIVDALTKYEPLVAENEKLRAMVRHLTELLLETTEAGLHEDCCACLTGPVDCNCLHGRICSALAEGGKEDDGKSTSKPDD